MSKQEARSAANRILQKYDVTLPPIPIEEIAKAEGIQITYDALDEEMSGVLIANAEIPVIAVNVNHPKNRQRFTIAHELGHFCLHSAKPAVFVDRYIVHYRWDKDENKAFDQKEIEANLFAACVLLPEDFLRQDLAGRSIDISDEASLKVLARRYQVSAQALTFRLTNLGMGTF